jgi:hypothetical protein
LVVARYYLSHAASLHVIWRVASAISIADSLQLNVSSLLLLQLSSYCYISGRPPEPPSFKPAAVGQILLMSREHFAIPAHLAFNHASYPSSFRPFLSTTPAASPSYSPPYYPRTDVSTPYLQAQYQQEVQRCQVTTPQLELSEAQWKPVARRRRFCYRRYREQTVLCLRFVQK